MEPASIYLIQTGSGIEVEGITTPDEDPPSIGDRTRNSDRPPHHQPSDTRDQSAIDATISGSTGREGELALFARFVADALKDSVAGLRKDEETRVSQFLETFQEEISAFRRDEENRSVRLERAITSLNPVKIEADPTTKFWTAYKEVSRELDNDLVSKYIGDLDASLLFAGLFSAITSAFIVQIIPELQPNPIDLTNSLLLRILQQNASFSGADPPTPISNVPTRIIRTQAILFTSLSATLLVASIAVLGKQWILRYAYIRATTPGNIVDRGMERQANFTGFQKWGFHILMELLPAMLQLALLLFGIALAVYLWDLNVSVAEVVLVVTSIGLAFYISITVAAMVYSDCPFQTPLSLLLPRVLPWAKGFNTCIRAWFNRQAASFLLWMGRTTKHDSLKSPVERTFRILTGRANTPNHSEEDTLNDNYSGTLSDPTLWRSDPIFTSPIPKDIGASAGFWLLENATDFSAASAVAAVFSNFQWPSHRRSAIALTQLRDTYAVYSRECKFNKSTRLKALQSAAAYYVLYHTQLIWIASNGVEAEMEKLPPDLPPDLFLHLPRDEWKEDDLFGYLLHIKTEDRLEPVKSARFLSYIAPYWFCGDSDSTIRFRPGRLQTLYELIEVLEDCRTLNPVTITDCILCVGAAMDFPLHPGDLIRVDKSNYIVPTFRMVVEHLHRMVLARGRRHRHTKTALEILLTIAKKITLPLVDAVWINGLLKSAVGGDMDDGTFALFLRLSARRNEEDAASNAETRPGEEYSRVQAGETGPLPPGGVASPEITALEHTLFIKILRNIQICSGQGDSWEDEAVYGGLIAVRDIPQLGSCLPDDDLLFTLYNAMGDAEKVENEAEAEKTKFRPSRVRKAAYNIMLAARDRWLGSAKLRQTLRDRDFPRRLHSVVIETGRSDYWRSFLKMMEVLSEDKYWRSYLREAMDIWLSFRREGPNQVLRILSRVGEIPLVMYEGTNLPPLDKFLEKLVEDEWAGVPGRPVMDLTADRLGPLAEVTKRFKDLLFAEGGRRAVLTAVEQVIPSLERRRDGGYEGPGTDVRGIVEGLLRVLREPMQSTSRYRSTSSPYCKYHMM